MEYCDICGGELPNCQCGGVNPWAEQNAEQDRAFQEWSDEEDIMADALNGRR